MSQESKYTLKDYKKHMPVWCPGCGDFSVLMALQKALVERQVAPHDLAVISGIGCSSRIPHFVNSYGFHMVHGRALPSAAAVKLANPNLEVVAAGGDGDGFAIGMGHFPHTCRRNPDMLYLVMDNEIYGLTKGQTSPTSKTGIKTKTTPWQNQDAPINPILTALSHNASFVARGISTDVKGLQALIKQGMEHEGFAFIQAFSPCLTFHDTYSWVRETSKPLPEDFDPTNPDRLEAMKYAMDEETFWTGVFRKVERPTQHGIAHDNRDHALAQNKKSPTPLMKVYQQIGGKVPTA